MVLGGATNVAAPRVDEEQKMTTQPDSNEGIFSAFRQRYRKTVDDNALPLEQVGRQRSGRTSVGRTYGGRIWSDRTDGRPQSLKRERNDDESPYQFGRQRSDRSSKRGLPELTPRKHNLASIAAAAGGVVTPRERWTKAAVLSTPRSQWSSAADSAVTPRRLEAHWETQDSPRSSRGSDARHTTDSFWHVYQSEDHDLRQPAWTMTVQEAIAAKEKIKLSQGLSREKVKMLCGMGQHQAARNEAIPPEPKKAPAVPGRGQQHDHMKRTLQSLRSQRDQLTEARKQLQGIVEKDKPNTVQADLRELLGFGVAKKNDSEEPRRYSKRSSRSNSKDRV